MIKIPSSLTSEVSTLGTSLELGIGPSYKGISVWEKSKEDIRQKQKRKRYFMIWDIFEGLQFIMNILRLKAIL
jgi:hypothetical protein